MFACVCGSGEEMGKQEKSSLTYMTFIIVITMWFRICFLLQAH